MLWHFVVLVPTEFRLSLEGATENEIGTVVQNWFFPEIYLLK